MGYKTLCKALLLAGLTISGAAMGAGASSTMLSDTCAACHGVDGNSQGPATPAIAGLSRGYFVAAMLAYKYGKDQAAIDKAIAAIPGVDADEFEVLARNGTIMSRIATGYTDGEIGQMADYFAKKSFVRHLQSGDKALAKRGKKLHEKNCEKCHEDGGTTSVDDVGILAGQWMPYLTNALTDFQAKHRKMPKKMAKKMKKLKANDLKALVHYYGTQR